MEFKIEIEITLTEEDIDKIMKVALEEGIGYWCQRAEVAGGKYLGEYASDQISRGGSLLLTCDQGEKELNSQNFLNGVKRAIMEGSISIENCEIDSDDIDCFAADQIIQYALFGDLIYA